MHRQLSACGFTSVKSPVVALHTLDQVFPVTVFVKTNHHYFLHHRDCTAHKMDKNIYTNVQLMSNLNRLDENIYMNKVPQDSCQAEAQEQLQGKRQNLLYFGQNMLSGYLIWLIFCSTILLCVSLNVRPLRVKFQMEHPPNFKSFWESYRKMTSPEMDVFLMAVPFAQ